MRNHKLEVENSNEIKVLPFLRYKHELTLTWLFYPNHHRLEELKTLVSLKSKFLSRYMVHRLTLFLYSQSMISQDQNFGDFILTLSFKQSWKTFKFYLRILFWKLVNQSTFHALLAYLDRFFASVQISRLIYELKHY